MADANELNKEDAAAAGQGVGAEDGNDANKGEGMPAPAAPSNQPPDMTPDAEEQKVAAEKLEAEIAEKAAADAKAKEEADAGDGDGDDKALDTDVWGSTGSEIGDTVLTMLQNSDVSTEDAKALLFDAIRDGDVSKIDKAALEAKVGKTKATLIMAGIVTFVGDTKTRNDKIVSDIKDAAGGEDNWTKLTDWTKGKSAEGTPNMSDEAVQEYRDMIDKGGAQARFAVAEIAALYNADKANTTLETATVAKPTLGDGGPGLSARSTSRAEYVEELTKAHRAGATPAVLEEITAARHRGRSQGK